MENKIDDYTSKLFLEVLITLFCPQNKTLTQKLYEGLNYISAESIFKFCHLHIPTCTMEEVQQIIQQLDDKGFLYYVREKDGPPYFRVNTMFIEKLDMDPAITAQ